MENYPIPFKGRIKVKEKYVDEIGKPVICKLFLINSKITGGEEKLKYGTQSNTAKNKNSI